MVHWLVSIWQCFNIAHNPSAYFIYPYTFNLSMCKLLCSAEHYENILAKLWYVSVFVIFSLPLIP